MVAVPDDGVSTSGNGMNGVVVMIVLAMAYR